MDEPGFLLRAVTWHFASGDALFVGWLLLILAAVMQARGWHSSRVILVTVLSIVWMTMANGISLRGLIICTCVGLCLQAWNVFRPTQNQPSPAQRIQQLLVVSLITLLLVGFELPWHWPLRSIAPHAKSLAIIGDSVTAGLNANDVTWPRQLTQSTRRTIYDASQQGATVKSAAGQLAKLNSRGEVLWIEIGGNDILESLPVDVYAERLESLLQSARQQYQSIVMMEIPAPPGGDGYGVAQRTLSKKHHIPLVPKRQFLAVLTTSGSTQDGVHLANAGHQRMAALVQKTLGWTDSQNSGDYQRVE